MYTGLGFLQTKNYIKKQLLILYYKNLIFDPLNRFNGINPYSPIKT